MKHIKILLSLTLFFMIIGCKSEKVTNIPVKLLKLEKENLIEQSEAKEFILDLFKPKLNEIFVTNGYSYRLEEFKEKWKMYEDKSYYIIVGSAGNDKNEIVLFTILYNRITKMEVDLEYLQLGSNIIGEYPKDIIPFK